MSVTVSYHIWTDGDASCTFGFVVPVFIFLLLLLL